MQQKLADLQVRERLQLVSCCGSMAGITTDFVVQSTSVQMESIWRMQVVRENATKRDIWKRCSPCVICCCSAVLQNCSPTQHQLFAAHRKVEQVAEETDHLRLALDKCNTRERRCFCADTFALSVAFPAVSRRQPCCSKGAACVLRSQAPHTSCVCMTMSMMGSHGCADARSRPRSARSCCHAARRAVLSDGSGPAQTKRRRSRGTSTTASGSSKRRMRRARRSSAIWLGNASA